MTEEEQLASVPLKLTRTTAPQEGERIKQDAEKIAKEKFDKFLAETKAQIDEELLYEIRKVILQIAIYNALASDERPSETRHYFDYLTLDILYILCGSHNANGKKISEGINYLDTTGNFRRYLVKAGFLEFINNAKAEDVGVINHLKQAALNGFVRKLARDGTFERELKEFQDFIDGKVIDSNEKTKKSTEKVSTDTTTDTSWWDQEEDDGWVDPVQTAIKEAEKNAKDNFQRFLTENNITLDKNFLELIEQITVQIAMYNTYTKLKRPTAVLGLLPNLFKNIQTMLCGSYDAIKRDYKYQGINYLDMGGKITKYLIEEIGLLKFISNKKKDIIEFLTGYNPNNSFIDEIKNGRFASELEDFENYVNHIDRKVPPNNITNQKDRIINSTTPTDNQPVTNDRNPNLNPATELSWLNKLLNYLCCLVCCLAPYFRRQRDGENIGKKISDQKTEALLANHNTKFKSNG